MGFQSGLSIYSDFSKKLGLAQELQSAKAKAKKPLSEEAKQRQREAGKAWREKRRAENLAQGALIRSRQPVPI